MANLRDDIAARVLAALVSAEPPGNGSPDYWPRQVLQAFTGAQAFADEKERRTTFVKKVVKRRTKGGK